jgi:N-acyl homoserine lactone hydrolase
VTGPVRDPTVRRVDFGTVVLPGRGDRDEPSRVVPCLGYLVDHPDGVVLVDTGIGSDPDVDDYYRPRRRSLAAALAAVGSSVDDVTVVVNCHLHFDHCGGNPTCAGRPIVVQSAELRLARGADYTLPHLVDAPGLRYTVIDGDAEVLPGISVIPTPGHTAGHQSVAVRLSDGTIVVAGQSHDTSSAYGADVLAFEARHDAHRATIPPPPAWIERLQQMDPRRVYFAHDRSVWVP